jgi:hypothetical protein
VQRRLGLHHLTCNELDPSEFVEIAAQSGYEQVDRANVGVNICPLHLPGDGEFPLRQILGALPAGAPIEVKIPSDRRKAAGRSALEFAHNAAARSRALVDALRPDQ